MNSRAKGYRGEKEWRDLVFAELGIRLRPPQGGTAGDDGKLGKFSLEVKRSERPSLYAWIEQAKTNANGGEWLLATRRSRDDWVVVMSWQTAFRLIREDLD